MVGGEVAFGDPGIASAWQGDSEIARETGSSRNTVRRYLRDESAARYKPRPREPALLSLLGSALLGLGWAARRRRKTR